VLPSSKVLEQIQTQTNPLRANLVAQIVRMAKVRTRGQSIPVGGVAIHRESRHLLSPHTVARSPSKQNKAPSLMAEAAAVDPSRAIRAISHVPVQKGPPSAEAEAIALVQDPMDQVTRVNLRVPATTELLKVVLEAKAIDRNPMNQVKPGFPSMKKIHEAKAEAAANQDQINQVEQIKKAKFR
jgi:hypothetical protein